ncbi:hypothetical protein ACWGR4_18235 [Embleya sp. NPDC055664]
MRVGGGAAATGSADRVVEEAGVRLAAADLRDLTGNEVSSLARHTRAAHRTWGVGVGLEVWNLGDGRVLVEPGVAHTRCGELLVLGADEVPFVPAQATGPLTLVLRAECGGPRARTRWVASGVPAGAEDVPLAVYHPDTRTLDVGDGARRNAHGPGPAVVVAGRMARGGTAAEGSRMQWSARIDFTRPFAGVPEVFVTAEGPPPAPAGATTVQVSAVDAAGFRITVRHVLPDDGAPTEQPKVSAVPMAFGWMAVLAAQPVPARPEPRTDPCPPPCTRPPLNLPGLRGRADTPADVRPGTRPDPRSRGKFV